MPRLKSYDPYGKLRILIVGSMKTQKITQADVGEWLGYARQTVNYKLKHPEELTAQELRCLARKLRIPAEDMRQSIPFG